MQNTSCVIFTNFLCGHLCQTLTVKPQNVSFSSAFDISRSTFNCHSTLYALRLILVIETSKCWCHIYFIAIFFSASHKLQMKCEILIDFTISILVVCLASSIFVVLSYLPTNYTLYTRWSSVTVVAISRLSLLLCAFAPSQQVVWVDELWLIYVCIKILVCNWCGVRCAHGSIVC